MLTDEELKLWDDSQINLDKDIWSRAFLTRKGGSQFVADRTNYLKFAPCPILDLTYFIRQTDKPERLSLSTPNILRAAERFRLEEILAYFEENPLIAKRVSNPNPPLKLFLTAIRARGYYDFLLKDGYGTPLVLYHTRPKLETAERNKLFRLLTPLPSTLPELHTTDEPLEVGLGRLVEQGRLTQAQADKMLAQFGTQPETETPATE